MQAGAAPARAGAIEKASAPGSPAAASRLPPPSCIGHTRERCLWPPPVAASRLPSDRLYDGIPAPRGQDPHLPRPFRTFGAPPAPVFASLAPGCIARVAGRFFYKGRFLRNRSLNFIIFDAFYQFRWFSLSFRATFLAF